MVLKMMGFSPSTGSVIALEGITTWVRSNLSSAKLRDYNYGACQFKASTVHRNPIFVFMLSHSNYCYDRIFVGR